MKAHRAELGNYNALCARCGFEYKGTELRREWTGLLVCNKCLEPKHPQDERAITRRKVRKMPFYRPDRARPAVAVSFRHTWNFIAGVGIAGLAVAGTGLGDDVALPAKQANEIPTPTFPTTGTL